MKFAEGQKVRVTEAAFEAVEDLKKHLSAGDTGTVYNWPGAENETLFRDDAEKWKETIAGALLGGWPLLNSKLKAVEEGDVA